MMKLPPKELLADIAAKVPEETYINVATPSYLHKNPLIRKVIQQRLTVLEEWITEYADPATTHLMDFGCGLGVLFPIASQKVHAVYGVDMRLLPAQIAIEYYNLHNVQLLLPKTAETEIPEQSIGIIVCSEVLEHIEHLHMLLQHFKNVMSTDAHLLVSLPTENIVYRIGRKIVGFTGDYHVYDAQTIHQHIMDAGFYLVRGKYIPYVGPLALYWILDYTL